MPRVGVLALQGDVREHIRALSALDVEASAVKSADEVEAIDALVIPGGESTTIGRLAERFGLIEPLRSRIEGGMPVFGTCAGMIFLAVGVTEGTQPQLGCLDIVVRPPRTPTMTKGRVASGRPGRSGSSTPITRHPTRFTSVVPAG